VDRSMTNRATGPCPPAPCGADDKMRVLGMLRVKGSQDRDRGRASDSERMDRGGKSVDACARLVCGGQPVV